jgi:hypothetical protein
MLQPQAADLGHATYRASSLSGTFFVINMGPIGSITMQYVMITANRVGVEGPAAKQAMSQLHASVGDRERTLTRSVQTSISAPISAEQSPSPFQSRSFSICITRHISLLACWRGGRGTARAERCGSEAGLMAGRARGTRDNLGESKSTIVRMCVGRWTCACSVCVQGIPSVCVCVVCVCVCVRGMPMAD